MRNLPAFDVPGDGDWERRNAIRPKSEMHVNVLAHLTFLSRL
jgi:hypothetical protein